MNYRYFFFFLIILWSPKLSHGQLFTGIVRAKQSKQPISDVRIQAPHEKTSCTSNQDGTFSLELNLSKPQTLELKHLGYLPISVTIGANPKQPFIVELTLKTTQLSEVEVIGASEKSTPFAATIIGIKPIQRSPIQDVGKFLRSEPNVGGIRKGAMGIDPVIRGLKYSQINVQLNNGTKIEGGCPNRMDPATAHVDLNDLQNIAIYKGPYALKYGPNFGGVIQLISNTPVFHNEYQTNVNMSMGGQTNYEGFKSRINIAGGNQLLAYSFTSNWNKYGDYESGDGKMMQGASNNYSVKGQVGVQPLLGQQFFVAYDRSWGRNVDFPTLPMDERKDDTEIYDFSYLGTSFGELFNFIRANVYNSDVQHEMDNKQRPFSDTVVAVSNIHAINTGGRIALNMDIGQGILEAGSGYECISKDGERIKTMITQPNIMIKTEELWNNALINNLGFFAEYQRKSIYFDWIFSARLDFNQGNSDPMRRYAGNGQLIFEDDDTKSNYTNFSFSAGTNWHFSGQHAVGISVGKGVRSPDMTERFITLLPIGYDNYDYLGNPMLKPEANHELDVQYQYNPTKWGELKTSLFFSYITDYISAVLVPPSEVKPQTKGVLGVKQFINIDDAYLAGFEAVYQTPKDNNWEASLSAAYTAGINPSAIKNILVDGQVVSEETIKNDPLPEIPPFEANLTFNYHFFKGKLTPGIKLRMVAAQNKVSDAYYEDSTPAFNTIELLVSYQYNEQLTVYGGISNLFNSNYYEHLNRRIIGSKTPYLEPGRICYLNLIIKL